ncbi:leucine-rich repeat extensin-like protein 7 [Iris pallida]|uniref:Leucine-rich repeat extensin-like protein 7 n=1 Tax=Iris pallida TaxID=29817 RepID=A0AAX6FVF9_IRIPA|nr:leucine-rich repeat extensin-like protein 7 [Iris pallida]KAJ6820373.1 leucine-rich repeat extensin-like protein 7 [Iris pallida]
MAVAASSRPFRLRAQANDVTDPKLGSAAIRSDQVVARSTDHWSATLAPQPVRSNIQALSASKPRTPPLPVALFLRRAMAVSDLDTLVIHYNHAVLLSCNQTEASEWEITWSWWLLGYCSFLLFHLFFWRLYLRDIIVYYFIGPDLSPAEFVF